VEGGGDVRGMWVGDKGLLGVGYGGGGEQRVDEGDKNQKRRLRAHTHNGVERGLIGIWYWLGAAQIVPILREILGSPTALKKGGNHSLEGERSKRKGKNSIVKRYMG